MIAQLASKSCDAVRENDVHSLSVAVQNGLNINSRQFLEDKRSLLMTAILSNSFECIDFLLENNADVTLFDDAGNTALHHACRSDNPEVIKKLIRAGANINAMSANFTSRIRSPLMYAAEYACNKAIGSLIEHGVNLTQLTRDARSAAYFAIQSENVIGVHLIRTAISDRELTAVINQAANKELAGTQSRKRGPGIF